MRRGLAPGRLSILFLDDDPFRHGAFARDARGHQVDHCWFVDDAMERLRRGPYDLACLDNDLETEGFGREGLEVAQFIAGLSATARPRAVLVHSWNGRRAIEMEAVLAPLYELEVTLARVEFGQFTLAAPGPACEGGVDLRRWIARSEALEMSDLLEVLDGAPILDDPSKGARPCR